MDLYKHQKQAVDFIVNNNGCAAIFADIGTGKTRMAIEAYSYYRDRDSRLKLLVICPLSLINSAWRADIKKFAPHLKVCNLREKFNLDADVYIINYESFLKRSHEVFLYPHIMAVIDESSKMKGPTTQITKSLLSVKDKFTYRIIMSATPAPNNMTEYWAQMTFVNSKIFHEKFYVFRNVFFHYSRGKQVLPRGAMVSKYAMREYFSKGFKLDITEDNKKALLDRMAPYTFRCRKEDCLDLPDTIDEVRTVELTSKQRQVYTDMHRHAITEIKGKLIPAPMAVVKLMKLREITSNFCINTRGEAVWIDQTNPKIKELKAILEEAGNRQVIIWGCFHAEIEEIALMLGDKCQCLYGKTVNKDDIIHGFQNKKFQYLICHPRSASHGLTFINCDCHVFYSLDYSSETYHQAKGRSHRIGQKNKVTYIHIIAEDSVDEVVYECVKNKLDQQKLIDSMVKDE